MFYSTLTGNQLMAAFMGGVNVVLFLLLGYGSRRHMNYFYVVDHGDFASLKSGRSQAQEQGGRSLYLVSP